MKEDLFCETDKRGVTSELETLSKESVNSFLCILITNVPIMFNRRT